MKLLMTWHFWTWVFAMYGIQHTVSDVAGWVGLAPAGGLRAGGGETAQETYDLRNTPLDWIVGVIDFSTVMTWRVII